MEQLSENRNRNIRIFISSTFSDMQDERDHLVNHVFPILRRKAEERNVTVTEVDLRWGITKEDSDSGRTVAICMEEIDNTRPFFIGLLGHRYGSTGKDLSGDIETSDRYEWLKKDLESGLSITEIEIQYGALRQSDAHAAFYIKSPNFKTAAGNKLEYKPDDRQETLKEKIRNQKRFPTHDYSNIEELGKMVEADFLNLLDQLYPIEEITTPEQLIKIRQWGYIEDKCRIYVSDGHLERELDNRVKSNESYTALVAPSGMGKSSLLSYWVMSLQKRDDLSVIPYFAGSDNSESLDSILIYVITEIAVLQNWENPLTDIESGADTEQIISIYNEFLHKIPAGENMVLVFDGLDRILDHGSHFLLNWLPYDLPNNVHIILSSASESKMTDSFATNKIHTLYLHPLIADKRVELINTYFSYFSKQLDSRQLQNIMQSRGVLQNTLMLTLFLDEIRRIGHFEEFDSQINALLGCSTATEFLHQIIKSKETRYNNGNNYNLVREVLSVLAVCKEGLTEKEILSITGIPQLFWSYFFCGCKLFFSNSSGKVNISHPLIKKTVWELYLMDKDYLKAIRQKITDSFIQETQFSSHNAMIEVPWQLSQLQSWDKLYHFMLNIPYLTYSMNQGHTLEFIKYWGLLQDIDKDKYDIRFYIQLAQQELEDFASNPLEVSGYDPEFTKKMMREILWDSYASSFHKLAIILLTQLDDVFSCEYIIHFIISQYQEIGTEDAMSKASEALQLLARIYHQQERFSESIELYQSIYDYWKRLYGENSIKLTTVLLNMADTYHVLGEKGDRSALEKAMKIDEEVLAKRIEYYGKYHEHVAVVYSNLASIYHELGNEKLSDKYQQEAIEIYSRLKGKNDYDLALEYFNRGCLLAEENRYKEAEVFARNAIETMQTAVGENNPNMKKCWQLLFKILTALDNLKEAGIVAAQYEKALFKEEENDPCKRAYRYAEMAQKYQRCELWDKSIDRGLKFLHALQEEEIDDPKFYTIGQVNLAETYALSGQPENAIREYAIAAEIYAQIGDKTNEALMFGKQSSVLLSNNRNDEALELQNRAIATLEESGLENSEAYAFCLYDRAVLLYYQDYYAEALEDFKKAASIRTKLFGADDPISVKYQQSVYELSSKIFSDIEGQQGQGTSTCKHEEEDYAEFAKVAKDYPDLCELFLSGCRSFDKLEPNSCIHAFNLALKWCDEHNISSDNIIRAHILRLWAYINEYVNKESKYEQIENAYVDAVIICEDNNDLKMAQKCASDLSEFNWNRGNYEMAERGYLAQLDYLLEQDDWDKMLILLNLGNIAQTLLKRDFMMPDAIADISYVQMGEAQFNRFEQLEQAAKNTLYGALNYFEKTREGFSFETYEPNFWTCVSHLTEYLFNSERPALSYKFIDFLIGEHCSDLSNTDHMNLYIHLRENAAEYISRLGEPEWANDILIETMDQMDDHAVNERRKDRLIHQLGENRLKAMDYEYAYRVFVLFQSTEDTVKAAECLYQMGRIDEAIAKLQEVDMKFWNEAPDLLVITLLKIGITINNSKLAFYAFDVLSKRNNDLSSLASFVMAIYAMPLSIMTDHEGTISEMAYNNKEALSVYRSELNTDEMAYAYVSMIDALIKCELVHEAKDVLSSFKEYLENCVNEDSTFWKGFQIISSRIPV